MINDVKKSKVLRVQHVRGYRKWHDYNLGYVIGEEKTVRSDML